MKDFLHLFFGFIQNLSGLMNKSAENKKSKKVGRIGGYNLRRLGWIREALYQDLNCSIPDHINGYIELNGDKTHY